MFPLKPDLIIGELKPVEAPSDRWCDCGHTAPKVFRREGPFSEAFPTRFFLVKNIKQGTDGKFCEPCLIVAHYLRQQKAKTEEINQIANRISAGDRSAIRSMLTGGKI